MPEEIKMSATEESLHIRNLSRAKEAAKGAMIAMVAVVRVNDVLQELRNAIIEAEESSKRTPSHSPRFHEEVIAASEMAIEMNRQVEKLTSITRNAIEMETVFSLKFHDSNALTTVEYDAVSKLRRSVQEYLKDKAK